MKFDATKAPAAEIRLLQTGDEILFSNLDPDVFDYAIDAECLARYLAEPNHHLIVALHDGQIIGQVAAVLHRHPDLRPTELYIDEVAVAERFQRQGIARLMLDAMLAHGRALGCEEAWVGTEPDNEPAAGLYAASGATAETFTMYVLKL